jgi:HPt (histidine-containing phosphotransfer) domain-containing protein
VPARGHGLLPAASRCGPAALLDALDRLCPESAGAPQELRQAVREVVEEAAPLQLAVLDRNALLARFEGDKELIVEVTRLFPQDCEKHMANAGKALALRDADGLGYALHSLRGMFTNLAADAARDAVAKLENIDVRGAPPETMEAAYAALEDAVKALNARLAGINDELAA